MTPSQGSFDRRLEDTGNPFLALPGLVLLLTAAIGVCALLILRNESLVACGGLLAGALLLFVMVRWQRGVYGLLLYLPVSGVVTLTMLPWNGPAIFNPVVFKDWLFVAPAYLGFAGAIVSRRQKFPMIGSTLASLLFAFVAVVLVEMVRPGVTNASAAFIGAKVWLGYVPLYVLGMALVTDRPRLTQLWRMLAATALLPCVLGLGEYVGSLLFGYDRVLAAIYGHNAEDVTQSLTWFFVGGGQIFRIPSTFTFEAQYFGFTLAMLVPCFAVAYGDPSRAWRRFGTWMLVFVALAGFLSGARAAYIFIPLLLALMYWLSRGFAGAFRAVGYTAAGLAGALAISRVAAGPMFGWISGLFEDYAVDTAYGGLVESLTTSWLGHGTGTNTGSARYALQRPEFFQAIQNYYAKAAYELGVLGFLILAALFLVLIYKGLKTVSSLRDPGLRAMASALTGLLIVIALDSFKGWILDLDPVNVYFWLFAGVLAGMARLDSPPPHDEETDTSAVKPHEVRA
jgi:hypothetical protein